MKDLFKIFGGFILVAFLAVSSFSSLAPAKTQSNSISAILDSNTNKEQISISLEKYGLKWTPDGHISYITLPNGERRYFFGANQKSYVIITKNKESFEQAIKNKPVIKQVFAPDPNVSYRNNYSIIAQVLQTDKNNPYHVFAFTQNEQQAKKSDGSFDTDNFTARIGLLQSFDGGLTWQDLGPVIKGDDYLNPGVKLSGAGEPCAVIKDGYVYVFYVNWSAQTHAFHPDEIFLARTKILNNGSIGAFEFYTTHGFDTYEKNLQAVISPSQTDGYTSLPSVSFNKDLNQFVAIYEVNLGFKMKTSYDLINWNNEKTVFVFPKPQSQRTINDIWYSYPSFLSDNWEKTDQITDRNGNLYFSMGVWPNTAHQPAVVKLSIQ